MGLSAAAVTALWVGGGVVAGAALASALKPKAPAAPTPPPFARSTEIAQTDAAANDAAIRQRKKAMGNVGRSDTILTGAGGANDYNTLGGVGSNNTQTKTLLGT